VSRGLRVAGREGWHWVALNESWRPETDKEKGLPCTSLLGANQKAPGSHGCPFSTVPGVGPWHWTCHALTDRSVEECGGLQHSCFSLSHPIPLLASPTTLLLCPFSHQSSRNATLRVSQRWFSQSGLRQQVSFHGAGALDGGT